jgi:hypothetical protein
MAARQRSAVALGVALILTALFATPAIAKGAPTLAVADRATLIKNGNAVFARVAVYARREPKCSRLTCGFHRTNRR